MNFFQIYEKNLTINHNILSFKENFNKNAKKRNTSSGEKIPKHDTWA